MFMYYILCNQKIKNISRKDLCSKDNNNNNNNEKNVFIKAKIERKFKGKNYLLIVNITWQKFDEKA